MTEPKNPQAKHIQDALARSIDYKRTFGSEQGTRVLHDLMQSFYMYQSTYSENAHMMAIREGGRQVVMHILSEMNVNPEKLRDIIRENLNGT